MYDDLKIPLLPPLHLIDFCKIFLGLNNLYRRDIKTLGEVQYQYFYHMICKGSQNTQIYFSRVVSLISSIK